MAKKEDEIRKAKEAKEAPPEVKPLTLMFFFASDNNLSPSMLYQLKSIKGARPQPDTNVVVHFDPHERGIPSLYFEINKTQNEKAENSSDYKDQIIRNLACDEVVPEPTPSSKAGKPRRSRGYDGDDARRALINFLEFCRKKYPARQYMLFLVGHGLVVGRDAFLPDDNPDSSIGLGVLKTILDDFNKAIRGTGELEVVGMHSCSMSAVEVAYELKGQAKYMMASEGLSFVGAWPYRKMLDTIFDAVEAARGKVRIPELVTQLQEFCVQNSADYIFAGYSSDLCLCSLDPERVTALTTPIQELVKAMVAGLKDRRGLEIIQLAHLESQSYFQEAYTDLYDFCLCLYQKCGDTEDEVLLPMQNACKKVIEVLTPGSNGPIIQADYFGPDCAHSYGLSIYFPWIRPLEDANEHVIRNYKKYDFVTELRGTSWLNFLETYFKATLRGPRQFGLDPNAGYDQEAALKFARERFEKIGFRGGPSQYTSALLTGKVNPSDAGGFWSPSSIKNYDREFSMSNAALKMFAPEEPKGETKMDDQKVA